ncbi:hypothetical protein C0J52_19340, partial [Blattella germanica]
EQQAKFIQERITTVEKHFAELCSYEDICKHSKEEVKNTLVARDRELTRRKNLDRIRERNPRNRQQISLAEAELLKASSDVSRTIKALEEQTDMFEKKKLQDMKSLLLSKQKEFRNALRVPDSISRLDTVKRTSFRNSSFSLASLFATPPGFKRQSQGIPHSPTTASATDTVESLKTGLEDSIESVHVEDYVEDESSSLVSEEEDRKHVRSRFK